MALVYAIAVVFTNVMRLRVGDAISTTIASGGSLRGPLAPLGADLNPDEDCIAHPYPCLNNYALLSIKP